MRDITLEETIYLMFTTRAFATGVPTVLAGTPVLSVYEQNNTTQITAGVSLTVDFDAVVGLNQATIVATAANGYEAGKSYFLVITTGTVGGVSVVGEVVGEFTVQASAAFTRIGADGASLSAIPWNLAWDAEVQSEVNDGLVAYNAASTTNITGGTITTVTNLTNAPTSGDLTATMKASVTTAATAATPTVAGVTARVTANTDQINGVATAAARLALSTQGIVTGTVGAASTTTSIVTSALDPAAAVIDQFKGRIVTFKQDTTTANLQGQSTDITASTALGVLTVTDLTTAPVSGDTFTIT